MIQLNSLSSTLSKVVFEATKTPTRKAFLGVTALVISVLILLAKALQMRNRSLYLKKIRELNASSSIETVHQWLSRHNPGPATTTPFTLGQVGEHQSKYITVNPSNSTEDLTTTWDKILENEKIFNIISLDPTITITEDLSSSLKQMSYEDKGFKTRYRLEKTGLRFFNEWEKKPVLRGVPLKNLIDLATTVADYQIKFFRFSLLAKGFFHFLFPAKENKDLKVFHIFSAESSSKTATFIAMAEMIARNGRMKTPETDLRFEMIQILDSLASQAEGLIPNREQLEWLLDRANLENLAKIIPHFTG